MKYQALMLVTIGGLLGKAAQAQDPRRYHHSACIVPFTDAGQWKYYVTWSSSYGRAWEHDIYSQIVCYDEEGRLQTESGPARRVGNGSDEAQEPVSAVLRADGGLLLLSAWEDGNTGTAYPDVRGWLHDPYGIPRTGILTLAGGWQSQHSVAVAAVRNAFLVAYADEAPAHGTRAQVWLKALDPNDGAERDALALSAPDADFWWPVIAGDRREHALVAWGNDWTLQGTVCSFREGALSRAPVADYLSGIAQYFYQVVWLEKISRFLLIAKENREPAVRSKICLIDEHGTRTRYGTAAAPIIREARPAVIWDPRQLAYHVVYPTGRNGLAVLKVTATEIELDRVVTGKDAAALRGVAWPATGVWAAFARSRDAHFTTWQGQQIVLLAMNRDTGNGIKLVSVPLPAGFQRNDADADGIPDTWERHYFGNLTQVDERSDFDGDGFGDAEEQIAGTQPNDARSRFAITHVRFAGPGRLILRWASAPGRYYAIEHTEDPAADEWEVVAEHLAATPPTNAYTIKAADPASRFYRLRVRPE